MISRSSSSSPHMHSSKDGWVMHGVLQRSSREQMREDMERPLEDGVEALHMFRCSSLPELSQDLVSPLKDLKSPTLLELKEYKDLRKIMDKLQDLSDVNAKYVEYWEELRIGRLKVHCVGFIQELLNEMSQYLLQQVGRKLQNVTEEEREKLRTGPFQRFQVYDRKCGTYLDLLHHNEASPEELYDNLLVRVEVHVIKHFSHVQDFPTEPRSLRALIASGFVSARKERDEESHVGMMKDDEKLKRIMQKVNEEIEKTHLISLGMKAMVPLVQAGIVVLQGGPEICELDEVKEDVGCAHKHGPKDNAKKGNDEQVQSKKIKERKGVKVTFRVTKACELGSMVYVLGFHKNLGSGSNPINMFSNDGHTWMRQIAFSGNEEIRYRYIVKCLEGTVAYSQTHESHIGGDPFVLESVWD